MIANFRPLDYTTKSDLNGGDYNLTKILCKHPHLITKFCL